MIIVMRPNSPQQDVERVVKKIETAGCEANVDCGVERCIVGIRSGRHDLTPEMFKQLPNVEEVVRILKPYKLASRDFHPDDTEFEIKGVKFGGKNLFVMAGPCSIESEEQIFSTARAVKEAGAHVLRGGAFKPRSSPYAFQGMGEEGLKLLSDAGREAGMPVVTEVLNPRNIDLCAAYSDILQVGARNMQNYDLLKELGTVGKPIFIKRGMAAKVEDLLMSAEYLMDGGCDNVILCERGIRTFETATRNTLDISAIPVLRKLSHLPTVVDPSHSGGHLEYVIPLALAGIAAGADGLMVEVHPEPECAMSDGQQSMTFDYFKDFMVQCRAVAKAMGREL